MDGGAAATLGDSGLRVSPIGLGLAALGRPGYINIGHATDLGGRVDVESMEHAAHALLDAAYSAGVRYFDAARSYGRAEAFLAGWLERRGLGSGEVTVGSKWLYLHRRLAGRRDRTRGQGSVARDASAPARREPGAPGGEPSPLPDPLGDR